MPKEASPPVPKRAAREAPPVYWVVAEALVYPSTRTGQWVQRAQRVIIDDLPAVSNYPATETTKARTGPNWVIGDRLVLPYTGDKAVGQKIPRPEAEEQYGGPLPGAVPPDDGEGE